MAEGIKIEIFKLKNADELTKSLSDPESRLDTGSGAAMTAALAAALLERAAANIRKFHEKQVRQSFLINDNKLGHTDGVIRRYDDKGRLINERNMGTEHLRHILQPGEFIVVEIVTKG